MNHSWKLNAFLENTKKIKACNLHWTRYPNIILNMLNKQNACTRNYNVNEKQTEQFHFGEIFDSDL